MKQSRIPTIEELDRHAHDLADAFDILLLLDEKYPLGYGRAAIVILREDEIPEDLRLLVAPDTIVKIVAAPPITDETSYAAVLHEMGHHCSPTGFDKTLGTMLREESAWEWAEYYALHWSVAMAHLKEIALGTYRRAIDKRNRSR